MVSVSLTVSLPRENVVDHRVFEQVFSNLTVAILDVQRQFIMHLTEQVMRVLPGVATLTPHVNLERQQNPNHHKHDFTNGVLPIG